MKFIFSNEQSECFREISGKYIEQQVNHDIEPSGADISLTYDHLCRQWEATVVVGNNYHDLGSVEYIDCDEN